MTGDSEDPRRRIIAGYIFLLSLMMYLVSSSGVNIDLTDGSYARYEVTKAIVERFDVDIERTRGITGADGRTYCWYSLGYSIISLPFYMLGKALGASELAVSCANLCFAAGNNVLMFIFAALLGASLRRSLVIALSYGFGTMAWPLAKHPFDHTVETFFLLLSFLLLVRYRGEHNKSLLWWASCSLGWAIFVRHTALLGVLPFIVLLALTQYRQFNAEGARQRLLFDVSRIVLALSPFAAAMLWYNYRRFGDPFVTGFTLWSERAGIDFFSGTPLLAGLKGFLLSPGKGVFFYSPVLAVIFISLRPFFRKHRDIAISFVLIILVYPLALAKNINWHGDWAWGPRYILPAVPFFLLPFSAVHDRGTRRLGYKGLLLLLILGLSVSVQIAAVSVDFTRYFIDLKVHKAIDFTVVCEEGIPCVQEPPPEVHFRWEYFPLAYHLRCLKGYIHDRQSYHFDGEYDTRDLREYLRKAPNMNLPDFWWVYQYYVSGSLQGMAIVCLLVLLASAFLYRAFRLAGSGGAHRFQQRSDHT